MFKFWENSVLKSKEKKNMGDALQRLIEESTLSGKFILFSILSGIIAALGVIMNNVTVLIGAMLIAPLLIPVISLSVGVGAGSIKLISHSIKALTVGITLSFVSAMAMSGLAHPIAIDPNYLQGFSDTALYAMVAIAAGVLGVYSWFIPQTNQIIPGVAIAVALVPPVALAGILVTMDNEAWLMDSFQLVGVNLMGIFAGGLLTFLLLAVGSRRPTLEVGKQVHTEVEKNKK
jgi:uncharacterized hydrophobic protein (TIGR00271 family)